MDKERIKRDYLHRIRSLHENEKIDLIKAIASDLEVDLDENNLLNEIRNEFLKDLNQVNDTDNKLEILFDVLNELDFVRSEIIVERLSIRWFDDL